MFFKSFARLACIVALALPGTCLAALEDVTKPVVFQEIRNATIKLDYGDVTFLIDPMLGAKGSYAAAPGALNEHLRNPLVDLPIPVSEVMKADAVIVTHLHIDHWDEAAQKQLPKQMPIFAQNTEDAQRIRDAGFADVRVLGERDDFKGVQLSRTDGQHGSDATLAVRGKQLGKVSGVVLQRPGFKTVYVAGDTVWNSHVEKAIAQYQPQVIVLNAGYVRFKDIEGAVIMGKEDLYRAAQAVPSAYIVASHLEALGHATQSRQELNDFIKQKQLDPWHVLVPKDGQTYSF
ncbi:MBL fold metallo-hydrolase [Pseudomonas asiatica]|uniref:MBL fold metallo-hydrolase n=1 Tax=Pseudomonas asiatica TaxID=2219225 RepID=UPI001E3372AA|nr:MBL fold metallo-hydrolase [Pseudomonas asiatica]